MEIGVRKNDILLKAMALPRRMPSGVAQDLLMALKSGSTSADDVGQAIASFVNDFSAKPDHDEDAIDQRGVWLALLDDRDAMEIVKFADRTRSKAPPFSSNVWQYLLGCWEQARTFRDNDDAIKVEIFEANREISRVLDLEKNKERKAKMSKALSKGANKRGSAAHIIVLADKSELGQKERADLVMEIKRSNLSGKLLQQVSVKGDGYIEVKAAKAVTRPARSGRVFKADHRSLTQKKYRPEKA